MLETVWNLFRPPAASPVRSCDLCGGKDFRRERSIPSAERDPVEGYNPGDGAAPDRFLRVVGRKA